MTPTVSITIVTYNHAALLPACLDALAAQTFQDFEIFVVDNASADAGQVAAACAGRARVQLLLNRTNRGYTGGQNQGMRLARGRYLMALNADVVLLPDYLAVAVTALERYPQVGTLSGKLLRMRPDGTRTARLDNAGLLLSRRRMPRHRGQGERDRGQYEQPVLVFGAMGSAALYRRTMLETIALDGQYFDERFFTWYEDIDLDWRGRRSGWDCLYLPQAVAYHVGDPHGHQSTPFAVRSTMCCGAVSSARTCAPLATWPGCCRKSAPSAGSSRARPGARVCRTIRWRWNDARPEHP
jgi:GT2 family glycosyltransferase